MSDVYDVVIIGAGPAGLTAGVYTSRGKLSTLIVEKECPGGKLPNRDMIENYPSYPEGILGPDLGSRMLDQAMNHGAEIGMDEVVGIGVDERVKLVKGAMSDYRARAVIIAGGASNRTLGVPGEEEFAHRGVYHCATCDGPLFPGKVVAVAGSGDSAFTEALLLARIAARVIIIARSDRCRATGILQDRVFSDPKIEVRFGQRIEAILGDDRVRALEVVESSTGKKSALDVDGIFVQIGLEPSTEYLRGIVPLDDRGYIVVDQNMRAGVPGIFAAGDVRQGSATQIATAVGDGATAGMAAIRYVTEREICV